MKTCPVLLLTVHIAVRPLYLYYKHVLLFLNTSCYVYYFSLTEINIHVQKIKHSKNMVEVR